MRGMSRVEAVAALGLTKSRQVSAATLFPKAT